MMRAFRILRWQFLAFSLFAVIWLLSVQFEANRPGRAPIPNPPPGEESVATTGSFSEAAAYTGNKQTGPESRTPPPPTSSPEGFSVRFKRSGEVGSGTAAVALLTSPDRPPSEEWFEADAAGRIILPAKVSGPVRIVDRETSLTLVQLPGAPLNGTTIDVWEPVRFVGAVAFGSVPPHRQVAVRLGTGPEEMPSARIRRQRGLGLRVDPSEDKPWGLTLRPAPSEWRIISLDEGGAFESPWILSEFPPQLLATSATGTAGLAAPSLEGLRPREVKNVTISLIPLTALEVSMEAPTGTEYAAVALGIREAEVDPQWAEEVAPIISVIDVVNPALSDFLANRGNEFLRHDQPLRMAPLPPFKQLTLVARGATPAHTPVRQLTIPHGEVTRVHFGLSDLFPVVRSTGRVHGRITVEGTGEPAANIRLTLSHALGRHETDTNKQGDFEFPSVPTELPLSVFIEAFDEQEPPRFSRSITEPIDPIPHGQNEVRWDYEVPGFRWLIIEDPAGDLNPGAQDRVIIALEHGTEGGWQDFTRVLDFHFIENACEAEIRLPGLWRAKALTADGWVLRRSSEARFGDRDTEQRVLLAPPEGNPAPRRFRLLLPGGDPAVGITAYVAPDFPDAQPTELSSDSQGFIVTPTTNFDRFRLRVDLELLHFGGEVEATSDRVADIRLESTSP